MKRGCINIMVHLKGTNYFQRTDCWGKCLKYHFSTKVSRSKKFFKHGYPPQNHLLTSFLLSAGKVARL